MCSVIIQVYNIKSLYFLHFLVPCLKVTESWITKEAQDIVKSYINPKSSLQPFSICFKLLQLLGNLSSRACSPVASFTILTICLQHVDKWSSLENTAG